MNGGPCSILFILEKKNQLDVLDLSFANFEWFLWIII